MQEAFPVKICQSIQSALEHLSRFPFREWPMSKDLRQVLLGVFHHNVEQPCVVQAAASNAEEFDQVGMRQLCSQFPPGDLRRRIRWIFLNEFYGGILLFGAVVGKENGAVFRATQVLKQAELAIDDLAFKLFPGFGHYGFPRPVIQNYRCWPPNVKNAASSLWRGVAVTSPQSENDVWIVCRRVVTYSLRSPLRPISCSISAAASREREYAGTLNKCPP